MSDTRLRAADLADELRSISSDKRMEYVPAQAVHLLIAADMLDANDELLMRLNAEYRVRQNLAAENARQREWIREAVRFMGHVTECDGGAWVVWMDELVKKARELGVEP